MVLTCAQQYLLRCFLTLCRPGGCIPDPASPRRATHHHFWPAGAANKRKKAVHSIRDASTGTGPVMIIGSIDSEITYTAVQGGPNEPEVAFDTTTFLAIYASAKS